MTTMKVSVLLIFISTNHKLATNFSMNILNMLGEIFSPFANTSVDGQRGEVQGHLRSTASDDLKG